MYMLCEVYSSVGEHVYIKQRGRRNGHEHDRYIVSSVTCSAVAVNTRQLPCRVIDVLYAGHIDMILAYRKRAGTGEGSPQSGI